ncbi:MAG TPA: hypothetical protein VK576_07025 [Thermoleophilia bacterium]|nr:hypothetical protein [Thermoleophilia bacterium]
MSWRSPERLAAAVLGASCEALWLGALVGAAAGSGLGRFSCLALVLTVGGLLLGRVDGQAARLAAGLGLTICLPVALVVATRPSAVDQGLVEALVAVAFATVAVRLGMAVGRPTPQSGLRRCLRCFLLTVFALAVSAAAGRHLAGAGLLIVCVVLAGVGHVALARVDAAAGATGASRRSLLAWLAAVVAVALVLLLVASGGALLLTSSLHGPLLGVATGLRDAVAVVGYAIGAIGYVVLRLAATFGTLFDLHLPARQPPHLRTLTPAPQPETSQSGRLFIDATLVALLGVALAIAVVVLILATRRRTAAKAEPEDEREALLSTRQAVRLTARRARAAVGRVVARARRPATPAEAVRLEYRRLESRLGRRGFRRPAATSARSFLLGLTTDDPEGLAATLASRYESARYAERGVSWADAGAFRRDADTWLDRAAGGRLPG